jgi:hypothetical protein
VSLCACAYLCACDVDCVCFVLVWLEDVCVGWLPRDIDFGMAEAVADLRTVVPALIDMCVRPCACVGDRKCRGLCGVKL